MDRKQIHTTRRTLVYYAHINYTLNPSNRVGSRKRDWNANENRTGIFEEQTIPSFISILMDKRGNNVESDL